MPYEPVNHGLAEDQRHESVPRHVQGHYWELSGLVVDEPSTFLQLEGWKTWRVASSLVAS